MKIKIIGVISALAIGLAGTTRSFAGDRPPPADPAAIMVDTLLVRPLCLAATVIGGAVFVISLPVAATSKSVHRAAEALVVRPAEATFTRPLGDFDDLTDD